MYSVQDAASLFKSQKSLLKGRKAGPAGATVGTTVLLLGLVSLLTDISAEMVTTVLPIYLITNLGFTPLQYGFIDGLQRGAAALVTIGGGYFADRTRRWKDVAPRATGSPPSARACSWSSAARSPRSARSSSWTASARASAPRRATR